MKSKQSARIMSNDDSLSFENRLVREPLAIVSSGTLWRIPATGTVGYSDLGSGMPERFSQPNLYVVDTIASGVQILANSTRTSTAG